MLVVINSVGISIKELEGSDSLPFLSPPFPFLFIIPLYNTPPFLPPFPFPLPLNPARRSGGAL